MAADEPAFDGDVAATIAAIRAEVRRRAGYADGDAVPSHGDPSAVDEAAALAEVSAHLPVQWRTPVVGRGIALVKRAERLALRWYINPIVEQQNAFNAAVVRALASLETRQQELARLLETRTNEQADREAEKA